MSSMKQKQKQQMVRIKTAKPPTRSIIKEEDGTDRVVTAGLPDYTRCDNTLITSKYTILNFLPLTIRGQFRRFANMYFLIVGIIMAIGTYFPSLFASAFSPFTTLGPLALFVSISLLMEGIADKKRHTNDHITNTYQCIIIENKDNKDNSTNSEAKAATSTTVGGAVEGTIETPSSWHDDVIIIPTKVNNIVNAATTATPAIAATTTVKFNYSQRKDIRQGHLVVIRNREMIPADTILLASSGDRGCAYIETSSIDGETNLKLRISAMSKYDKKLALHQSHESIEDAVLRISKFTAIGCFRPDVDLVKVKEDHQNNENRNHLSSVLTTEPPDAHINTFSGKLTMPISVTATDNDGADGTDGADGGEIIPLGSDHLLLRGAVLRNTEWVIGIVSYTGTDTKLSQNSIDAPSKFSQLDLVTNKCVIVMIIVELICIIYLSTMATRSSESEPTASNLSPLWYLGINTNNNNSNSSTAAVEWPYLPDLNPPKWEESGDNWIQNALTYITLLSYFVPLSMYFTLEIVNFFLMYLIYVDDDMYDETTNTIAEPRSTIVTDLGQIQYIFTDKTGTLTQNVMRFKRCSIDGFIFGAPVEKTRPSQQNNNNDGNDKKDDNNEQQLRGFGGVDSNGDGNGDGDGHPFHPTKQVLVGQIHINDSNNNGDVSTSDNGLHLETSKGMTFNAELFLRVMSLCHTVVVEKDLDLPKKNTKNDSSEEKKENDNDASDENDDGNNEENPTAGNDDVTVTIVASTTTTKNDEKSADGAPFGYAYQAESPDEGALVSEASKGFGFQVISRDSRGIKLKCDHPTLFHNDELVQGLKDGTLDMKKVAADSASACNNSNSDSSNGVDIINNSNIETWSVLAINKFDSTRKRMSILVRSPQEFGNVAILLCKGADSAMLDPEICSINHDDDDDVIQKQQQHQDKPSEWEVAKMLGIESHLGEFASEGLRTLVLGVRFLTDKQCDEWMSSYTSAAASIKDRDTKLKLCASEIEKELHIVGATAIEDKLQKNVPKTIATLAKAGIKLWVLTGDKRETAIEIGYSTQVLTPQMHLTEISDRELEFVRAQCAMEFMRLVKAGKLPAYQRAVVDQPDQKHWLKNVLISIGKVISVFFRILKRFMLQFNITLRGVFGFKRMIQQQRLENLKKETSSKKETPNDLKRRRNVRNRAEKIVKRYAEMHPVINKNEPELSTDNLPPVFNRAQSAKETLVMHRSQGKMTSIDERESRLSQLTVQNLVEKQKQQHHDTSGDGSKPTIDDDMLSLQSFYPSKKDKLTSDFDKKKRTPLERIFAVDRDVRKGRLVKHLKKEKPALASSSPITPHAIVPSGDGPRALIIEGNALKHLQGDSELEELIFNIASQATSVIACRVTPAQKAQLVKLVRHHVVPEPVTLAIGDGANDVGMIHEAHVGIGISGKEGKQAVNASDFSIGQFRFLEDLILYHGRWDYMRTSTVVLYSFYKNFVIAGCLVLYNHETLFSGTSLFDQWLNSGFSFWAFFPILFLGMFDRNLEKSYIRKNPEVYKPTRQKELITARILSRWIFMAIAHVATIYYGQMQQLSQGGGSTSAFLGLMSNKGTVGDGQNSDWQSMGTTIFTSMILLLAYKVMYECRSIINGRWPYITCSSKNSEGFMSRIPYTWFGVSIGSFLFYILTLYLLSGIGQVFGANAGTFFAMVAVPQHVLGTSSMNYALIFFIPIAGMAFDVAGKVFSNCYYPSQTQIHIELEAKAFAESRKTK